MKKILGLTVAAMLVMGLVGGGTWAFFSDPESSTGNTMTSGTLDLSVDTEKDWVSTPVTFDDMFPGETRTPVTISLENVGTITADLWMRITNVVNSGGVATYPTGSPVASSEPEYKQEGGPSLWVADDTLSDSLTLDVDADSAPVAGIDAVLIDAAVTTGWVKIKDDLAASGTVSLDLGATLSSGAGNEYQGDVSTFSIEFQLLQVDQTP